MILINLLHFYQPSNQQDDILDRIVNESYRPILQGMLEKPTRKLNINISGSLTSLLLSKGYTDVIENLKELKSRKQIEFTASAMYHPILPLLPKEECIRQIELNDAENKKAFGSLYDPKGFFPPEMAVNAMVFEICADRGYEWIAAPTISCPKDYSVNENLFVYKATDLKIFFRNKPVSSIILSAQVRTAPDLLAETKDFSQQDAYWFTVMDAETFGHHRIGHETLLFELMDSTELTNILGSEIGNFASDITHVSPLSGTWTNDEQDSFLDGTDSSFILWNDPTNPIHKKQWELTQLVIKCLEENRTQPHWQQARILADSALASDQYWWASAKPWWSLEMVELGAFSLKSVITTLFQDSPNRQDVKVAKELYTAIIDLAFEWQRSGYVRKIHSDMSTTHSKPALKERTPAEWFNQLILEFEYEMNKAVAHQDFERAIKWRDAILKISLGTDKYDILHVVDELWLGRNTPWATPQVKPFLEHDWAEFSTFAKGHFLEVANQEDFENWKKRKS